MSRPPTLPFSINARAKGYTHEGLALAFGLSLSGMQKVCASPTARDWLALEGLPDLIGGGNYIYISELPALQKTCREILNIGEKNETRPAP